MGYNGHLLRQPAFVYSKISEFHSSRENRLFFELRGLAQLAIILFLSCKEAALE